MAELLWRRREVVTVLPSNVGTDAAALTPPLVAVSSQAGGKTNKQSFQWRWWPHSFLDDEMGVFFVFLPSLDVLWHDAPRQVVVAVVTPRVVKEIRPGGEDVARQPWAALWDQQRRWHTLKWFTSQTYTFICLPINHPMAPERTPPRPVGWG